MAGLEIVPKDLIARYEKLRGGHSQEYEGCPICQEDFLCEDNAVELDQTVSYFAELPHNQYRPPTILAFPCPGMHLYHSNCLTPWLSRKTTCPSCRFDIDPHSLTLSCVRAVHSGKWEPPKDSSFLSWLQGEENKQGKCYDVLSLASHSPLGMMSLSSRDMILICFISSLRGHFHSHR